MYCSAENIHQRRRSSNSVNKMFSWDGLWRFKVFGNYNERANHFWSHLNRGLATSLLAKQLIAPNFILKLLIHAFEQLNQIISEIRELGKVRGKGVQIVAH